MAARTRSLYRSLLRELPPRPLLTTSRAPLHAMLRTAFDASTVDATTNPTTSTANSTTTNPTTSAANPTTTTSADHATTNPTTSSTSSPSTTNATANAPTTPLAHAYQLLAYLRAQRQYVSLLERYNSSAAYDDSERVRLSARRIGMNMPEPYKP